MVRYFKKNRGNFYTIVAILCIANLILGFEFIKKVTYKSAVPTFNNNQIKGDKKTIKIGEDNKLLLELLTSSNVYMKVTLNEDYEIKGIKNKVEEVLGGNNYFDPKTYLKSQLPAMFALVSNSEVKAVSSTIANKSLDKDKNDNIVKKDVDEDISKHVESTKDLIKSEKPKSIKLDDTNPYVMIYHTHATESYSPVRQNNYHVDKKEQNVLTIGEIMGGVLKEKGHKVKHIEKYHDLPSYNKSYTESLKTVKEELGKNENLKIILDVHRNGIDENSKYIAKAREAARVNINGKSAATFFMVIGPDNPNKEQLLKFSRYIRDKANEKYPGLCTGITVKPYGKFNQYVSDHYALLEIGSNLNTMDEAKETAKLVGEILDEVIVDLKEEK